MADDFPIRELRREMGLKLTQFMTALGVASEGHMSELERGIKPCSLDVALKLEALGREHGLPLDAADLCEDVRRARESAPVDQSAGAVA
jgi:predicted transcriptional regulator